MYRDLIELDHVSSLTCEHQSKLATDTISLNSPNSH